MVRRATKKESVRNRLEVDERRAQLLQLGLTLFSATPYDGLKIEEVASRAGISKGLLYHYFPTKRAFYVEVLRAAALELVSLVDIEQSLPPLDRARRSIDTYLSYVSRHGAAYVALLRGGLGADPEVATIIEDTRVRFLTRAIEGLGIDQPPPLWRLALRGWIGFVEASSIEWVAQPTITQDELRELLLKSLVSTVLMVAPDYTPGAL
jgi:AcrR family transcriptional regulator